MKVRPTPLPGCVVIEPRVHGDSRGWFFESFNAAKFAEAGADVLYVLTGQRASISLKIDERLLLERYRESPKPLREAALRVLLGESQSVGAATQNFHGPVSGGVAGRDIVNKGKK